MAQQSTPFSEWVPENYDRYLGPMLFDRMRAMSRLV
jgi:hypothetical protein